MLGDLHLIHLVFTDEGSHFGEALPAGAPNTHQQHVTPELADHAHRPGDCRGTQGAPISPFMITLVEQPPSHDTSIITC